MMIASCTPELPDADEPYGEDSLGTSTDALQQGLGLARTRNATASASSFTNEACGFSTVQVWARDGLSLTTSGTPSKTRILNVFYSAYSYCTGVSTFGQADVALEHGIDMQGLSERFSITLSNFIETDGEYGEVETQVLPETTLSGTVTLTGSGYTNTVNGRALTTAEDTTRLTLSRGNERPAAAQFGFFIDGKPIAVSEGTGILSSTVDDHLTLPRFPNAWLRARAVNLPKDPLAKISSTLGRGATASFTSAADVACVTDTLEVTATDEVNTLAEGAVLRPNAAILDFARSDTCEVGLTRTLSFRVRVDDVVQVHEPLEAIAFSVAQEVQARRCVTPTEGGPRSCASEPLQLRADLLWEGTGKIDGEQSDRTDTTERRVVRRQHDRFERPARVMHTFTLNGESVALVADPSAALLWQETVAESVRDR